MKNEIVFKYNKNILIINDKQLEFEYEIEDIKEVNGILAVLLGVSAKSYSIDNLYGVNSKGEIIWRVQSVNEIYPSIISSPYVALKIAPSGDIAVTNFAGVRYFVNPKDGSITGKEVIGW